MARKKTPSETFAENQPADSAGLEYTVLARRYRPQQFKDLIGQEPVAQALVNALKSGRVAHAYLFTGARGVGKTSAARILAKALNCEQGPTTTPCDQCDSCKAVAVGEDVDVLEIDGASNNRIDEVREIRQNVNFRPSRSRYKIYIIDEVHMLTNQAFNALLKTLEEPPPHVKFIFATTEVNEIPITILSRCQRFDFSGISTPGIVSHLRQIVAGEKMQADDEALELIARRAGGSMRDAQSLLDQLLAFGRDRLTVETVHHLLGTAREDKVAELASAALARDSIQTLQILNHFLDHGTQPGELLDQLLNYWRDLLVVNAAGPDQPLLSVFGTLKEALHDQAKKGRPDTFLAGMDLLLQAKKNLRASSHARILLEMALIRICRLEDLMPLGQLTQWLAQEGAARPAQPVSPVGTRAIPTSSPPEKKKLTTDQEPPANFSGFQPENLADLWSQLLNLVGLSIATDLRKAEVAISGPNSLVFRFPPGYNSLEGTRLARVQQALKQVTGQDIELVLETSKPVEAGTTEAVIRPTEAPLARNRRLREEAVQFPLVNKAREVMGAQIVHIDDDFGALASAGNNGDESSDTLETEEG